MNNKYTELKNKLSKSRGFEQNDKPVKDRFGSHTDHKMNYDVKSFNNKMMGK